MELRIEIVADEADLVVEALSKVISGEFGGTSKAMPDPDADILRGTKAETVILVGGLLQGTAAETNLLAKAGHVVSAVRALLKGMDSCVMHGSGPKPVDLRRAKPQTVARALSPAPTPTKPGGHKPPRS